MGDEIDFEAFYASEYGRTVALAYALTGDQGQAEDLAQDAFLVAHRRWSEVSRFDAPEAWVRRVLMNKSRSWYRRSRRVAAVAEPPDVAAKESAPDAETEWFWAVVRTLPRRQTQCVTLHYLDDLDAAGIARLLGCSPASVRVHLHRARKELAKAFTGTRELL